MINKNACDWFVQSKEFDSNGNLKKLCVTCSYQSWEHADHYAIESITVNEQTIKAGDTVRLNSMKDSAFCYATILGFSPRNYVRIARPYAYASSVGTTCANALLGCEVFNISLASMLSFDNVQENSFRV